MAGRLHKAVEVRQGEDPSADVLTLAEMVQQRTGAHMFLMDTLLPVFLVSSVSHAVQQSLRPSL
jgi:hypothetical protein